jgi:DNA-binding IclR family transcriptional regulator
MPDTSDDARSGGTEIQAVDRAAQILRLFGPETPELTAGEAAERLELNRTTTYRYCTSLASSGLLERGTAPGTFVPGALLLQLGRSRSAGARSSTSRPGTCASSAR